MRVEPFEMERLQSEWENRVEINLSESSVHPVTVQELIGDGESLAEFAATKLGYNQTNGSAELRRLISSLYTGAGPDNVLVTNGTAEANYLAVWKLLEGGDEMVLMLPNYMQIWGASRGFGVKVIPFRLQECKNWAPDLEELRRAVTPKTKLIAVCNPNNPTGAVLSAEEMREIVEAARRVGAWLLADEVYQGAERNGATTSSFWGLYDKTLITNGLSKAYGVPGIRIGWMVGPKDVIASLWSYHDYTTIAIGTLSDALARVVLAPGNRERILERTRSILRRNYPLIEQWVRAHSDTFSMVPPVAGAIAYLKYALEINSSELVRRLRDEKSVLVVPGDHFGMDRYLRVNFGPPAECLQAGLERLGELVRQIRSS
ncbi:MAG: aminotransferase class I/II-fold pyridoxal phosphate-dependent enzyme [Acidobacteria bacterium]|nr:aminotransferase class I/II-fold pyridoxal phosphate-dependent enzyme [Acidobacteriota bacterium]